MKIFPESWVPDPDKKFSPLDESLIDKIIAGVLKSDPKFEFIESKHVRQDHYPTWSDAIFSDGGEYNQMIISSFKKGEKDFGYVFYKISEYNKKTSEIFGLYNSNFQIQKNIKLKDSINKKNKKINNLLKKDIMQIYLRIITIKVSHSVLKKVKKIFTLNL